MEIMEETEFKHGMPVYLASGEIASYIAFTHGKHIVQMMREVNYGYDEPPEMVPGEIITVSKVYSKPPVETKNKEIEALNAVIDALEDQRNKLNKEVAAIKNHRTELESMMKQNDALSRIKEFIDGKITHILTMPCNSYEKPTITELLQAITSDEGSYYRKQLKLLTLFGATNGDFAWKLNTYSDGSGCWRNVYPCKSVEEAQQKAIEIYNENVEKWRKGERNFDTLCRIHNTFDFITIPDDLKKYIEECNQTARNNDIERRTVDIKKWIETYPELIEAFKDYTK